MKKLRLDLDTIAVEAFVTTPQDGQRGTLFGYYTMYYESCGYSCGPSECLDSCRQTQCDQTCNFDAGCYGETDEDNLCTGNCTGIGVECYTADPMFYDCTGGACNSGGPPCTHTTCTVNNVTCVNC